MPTLRTVIVGTRFHGDTALDRLGKLRGGDPVTLAAAPEHPEDANAVVVVAGGIMVGYIPRDSNQGLAAALNRRPPAEVEAKVVLPARMRGAYVLRVPEIQVTW